MREMTMTDLKYANRYGYTDVEPYEIVRVISDLTVEVRAMRAERDESVKLNHIPGGFFAHCSNQRDQKWFDTAGQKDSGRMPTAVASNLLIFLANSMTITFKNKGWCSL
jgi:hypothetical protein